MAEETGVSARPMLDRLPERGDKAKFAKKIGVAPQDITNWSKRGVPHSKVRAVAKALGITTDQYYAEAGAPPPSGKPADPRAAAALGARAEVLKNLEPKPEIMTIPVFDVAASMGLGAAMPMEETVVDHLRLAGTWVRRNLPGVSSTLNLAVISAYGDSMKPLFDDGDILLVDRGVTALKVDAVYVLAFRDELYIKRIQRFPDGSVKIKSENPSYEPITVTKAEVESVRVLGRVLWAWNGKRM
jgi:SOS-response transcriptional repressor LexA